MATARRVVRLVAINLGLIVLLLIPVEFIMGSWIVGPKFGMLGIPRDITRYYDTAGLYPGGGTIRYVRDAYGLRGDYGRPSDIGLLVMGGSSANELYVDETKTWTTVLVAGLKAAGLDVPVANAAVDGQSTVGHLKAFEVWLPEIPGLKPRYVLAYVGINDIIVEGAARADDMQHPTLTIRCRNYLANHSAVYGLVRTIRGYVQARNAHVLHGSGVSLHHQWTEAVPQPDIEAARHTYAARLAAYESRIEALAWHISDMGATPIFVTQVRYEYVVRDGLVFSVPDARGVYPLEAYVAMTLFNRSLLAACRRVDAICIDLASEIGFENGDFYDNVHTTPAGSRRIGEYLTSKLAPILAARATPRR